MGKRELLLIAVFALLGTVVYFATAPDRPDSQRRFSFRKILDEIRREVRGNQASAELTTSTQHALTSEISEIRVQVRSAQVTIIGEKRADIAAELYVWSNGFDDAQAKTLAGETRLKVEPAGPSMLVTIAYPQPGSQRARLKLRVPAHLPLQFEPTDARLEVSNVAAVDHESARGETILRQIPGRVTVTHRGGKLIVTDVGAARLNTRGSHVELARVKGETALQVQSGEIRCTELMGPVEIEAVGAEIVLDQMEKMRESIRVNATDGKVTVRGLRTGARIDGRDTEIHVAIDQAAAIAIFNIDERIDLVPPPDGYQLDAVASSGRIAVADSLKAQLTVQSGAVEKEERIAGKVNGGGPTITVRNTRGEIRIAPRTPPTEEKHAPND
jgi:hypothetical protein